MRRLWIGLVIVMPGIAQGQRKATLTVSWSGPRRRLRLGRTQSTFASCERITCRPSSGLRLVAYDV